LLSFALRPSSFVLQAEVLLDPLDIPSDFGQFLQGDEDAQLLALGHRRRAEGALARGNVLAHPRLGADYGAVADVDVVGDPHLAGGDDVIAGAAGAGDAHLADEEVVPADPAVVADLHKVVDLGAGADARGLEGAAVDGRAGADLDVIADLDVAELRHLNV